MTSVLASATMLDRPHGATVIPQVSETGSLMDATSQHVKTVNPPSVADP